MTMSRLLALALMFVVLAGFMFVRRGRTPAAVDLVAKFYDAERRPLGADETVLAVRQETIAGATKRSIFAFPLTRITWVLTLPNGGWLRTFVGIDEKAWDKDGDGVQFRVGISSPSGYDEMMAKLIDPRHNPADRRWVPVAIDLSRYSGQRVKLVLSTDAGARRSADKRNDLAYWGAPAITLR